MNQRAMKRQLVREQTTTKRAPVFIAIIMPCPLTQLIDCKAAMWCTSQVATGQAIWFPIPGRQAEDGRNFGIIQLLNDKHITHFFFLDADTIPPKGCIQKLLDHDKDFVGGVTPVYDWNKKRKAWNVTLDESPKHELIIRDTVDCGEGAVALPIEPFQAVGMGGTTMLVKRKVFDFISRPFFMTMRDDQGRMVLSEDLYFCKNVKTAGYDIWIDPSIVCTHRQLNDLL